MTEDEKCDIIDKVMVDITMRCDFARQQLKVGYIFMEKNIEFGELLDTYGMLLPQNQFDLIDMYCNADLSLSEISENEGITRQGVHDKIKRGQQQLLDFEEKLGLLKKKQRESNLYSALEQVKNCLIQGDIEKAKLLIDDILKESVLI